MTTVDDSQQRQDPRILYIWGTKVPPSLELSHNPTYWLSHTLRGELLQLLWWPESLAIEKLGAENVPSMQVGRFRHHFLLAGKGSKVRKWWRMIRFFLREGIRLHRQESFDCIVVYAHMSSGICGVILKLLLRRKLIIRIATSPKHIGTTNRPRPTLGDYLTRLWSDFSLHVAVLGADRVHLLAPDLLDRYPLLRRTPVSVFHEFACAARVPRGSPESSQTIVMVGMPWYLKGVDVLLRAFLALEEDYPEARLQLLGHQLNSIEIEAIAKGHPRVEFLGAKPNAETIALISQAAVLVLPSRCEGMGRVLIEAMSAGVPVVGSRIGGIPHMIRDGENGFLFPSEDVAALEAILRKLLADPALRHRLGETGRNLASREFTEQRHAEHFTAMVHATIEGVE